MNKKDLAEIFSKYNDEVEKVWYEGPDEFGKYSDVVILLKLKKGKGILDLGEYINDIDKMLGVDEDAGEESSIGYLVVNRWRVDIFDKSVGRAELIYESK